MVSNDTFKEIALSFPETDEHKHFDKIAYRLKNKIFATLDKKLKRGMVKLSPLDQSVFCAFDKTIIYPVPGGWGRQGCTFIELKKVKKTMLKDALTTAYINVAPPKLGDPYRE
jgi:hypothetical protein